MSNALDPIYARLGIYPRDGLITPYLLLGLAEFEGDPAVIQAAADRQKAFLRQGNLGLRAEAVQNLVLEVEAARQTLLDPAQKAPYDRMLRQRREPARGTAEAAPSVAPAGSPMSTGAGSSEPAAARREEPAAYLEAEAAVLDQPPSPIAPAAPPLPAMPAPKPAPMPLVIVQPVYVPWPAPQTQAFHVPAVPPPMLPEPAPFTWSPDQPAAPPPGRTLPLWHRLGWLLAGIGMGVEELGARSVVALRRWGRAAWGGGASAVVAISPAERRLAGAWLTALVLPAAGLAIIRLIPRRGPAPVRYILASPTEVQEELDELQEEAIRTNVELAVWRDDVWTPPAEALVMPEVPAPSFDTNAGPLLAPGVDRSPFGRPEELLQSVPQRVPPLVYQRTRGRAALLERHGGTRETERAVSAAIIWLTNHQAKDGSWDFDHVLPTCGAECRNSGELARRQIGATGLALLPLLGAGFTPDDGPVRAGLRYLISRQDLHGSLVEPDGTMYSHALATIALCEAAEMSGRAVYAEAAQAAIDHIVVWQDPAGGGWRYNAREAGDVSATGWQLQALYAGHRAGLKVPPDTLRAASRFLDGVQLEGGAKYGYMGPGGEPATSAAGLLCRIQLGWSRRLPALERGADFLLATGVSPDNWYYNYYATRVLRNLEGERWAQWTACNRLP